MKVMWFTTMILPDVAEVLQIPSGAGSGGWVMTMLDELCKSSEIESINVVTVYNVRNTVSFCSGKVEYTILSSRGGVFTYDPKLYISISEILEKYKPDVIDVHGIEFFLGKSVIETGTAIPIAATLQGLTCEIHKFYFSGIPFWDLIRNRTLRDNLLLDGIIERKFRYKKRGYNEIATLQKLKYVIGRTQWDNAVSASINPALKYFTCNRILRNEFYSASWDLSDVERYSLFMTQAHYSIKGLHLLLHAVSILVKDFPQIKLYVAGKDLIRTNSVRDTLSVSGYQKYVKRLIDKYKLHNLIIFTGKLNSNQVVRRLQKAHVFVLPSIIENSPNALAEAQMVGVPSVAALVGGVGDFIQDGFSGLLYNSLEPVMLASKIKSIFNDDDFAINLSINGKRVAMDRHDKSHNSQQLISIYKHITSQNF